jgi:hypothetical protein
MARDTVLYRILTPVPPVTLQKIPMESSPVFETRLYEIELSVQAVQSVSIPNVPESRSWFRSAVSSLPNR